MTKALLHYPAAKRHGRILNAPIRGGLIIFVHVLLAFALSAFGQSNRNWPEFRGEDRTGVSEDRVPVRWSANTNIQWKRELPGHGASSPVVWDRHVYLTCYSGYGLSAEEPGDPQALTRHVVCVDKQDGRLLWKKDYPVGNAKIFPFRGFRAEHGYATSTAAADDDGVYIWFGTGGMVALDHDGEERWHRILGDGICGYGSAASPILYENVVIIHADVEAQAIIALDKRTGAEVWRASSGDQPDSRSTPLIVNHRGRDELVYLHTSDIQPPKDFAIVAAVNPRDGNKLWTCNAVGNYLEPSPILGDGLIYVMSKRRSAAIRPGGRGDVTQSHRVWINQYGDHVTTPVHHDGHLYWPSTNEGLVFCVDAKTGDKVFTERLRPSPKFIYASPVIANGHLYIVSRHDGVFVLAAKPAFELVAHNVIEGDDSRFQATPAISDGHLFLRSNKFLYCIGDDPFPSPQGEDKK